MVNKKIKVFFMLMIMLLFLNISTIANAIGYNVVDDAMLLSEDEIELLGDKIDEVHNATGFDLIIVTTNDTDGKSSQAYADEYYDKTFNEKSDGALLLINMDEREVWISTQGNAIKYLTDGRVDNILDKIQVYLSEGNYYKACDKYLDNINKYYDEGIPSGFKEIKEDNNFINSLIIAIFGSLAIALVSCGIVIINYKKPSKYNGGNYVDNRDVYFSRKEDIFITSYTKKTKIERNNSSSNTSTTHTSSSGRTHGGGGRKF